MVVVNELEKAVPQIKTVSPQTFVLARITGRDWIHNAGFEAGRQRVRELAPLFQAVPADCFSIANEWIHRTDLDAIRRGVDTYLGAIRQARELGFEICVGDWNTGHPDLSNPDILNALRPMLAEARYVNVHYYARNGNPAVDDDALLWIRMVRDYPHVRVIIGELGILENDGLMPRGEAFSEFLRAADDRWKLWRHRLVGVALYTLKGYDGGEWEQCRWESEVERYKAYVRATGRI